VEKSSLNIDLKKDLEALNSMNETTTDTCHILSNSVYTNHIILHYRVGN